MTQTDLPLKDEKDQNARRKRIPDIRRKPNRNDPLWLEIQPTIASPKHLQERDLCLVGEDPCKMISTTADPELAARMLACKGEEDDYETAATIMAAPFGPRLEQIIDRALSGRFSTTFINTSEDVMGSVDVDPKQMIDNVMHVLDADAVFVVCYRDGGFVRMSGAKNEGNDLPRKDRITFSMMSAAIDRMFNIGGKNETETP